MNFLIYGLPRSWIPNTNGIQMMDTPVHEHGYKKSMDFISWSPTYGLSFQVHGLQFIDFSIYGLAGLWTSVHRLPVHGFQFMKSPTLGLQSPWTRNIWTLKFMNSQHHGFQFLETPVHGVASTWTPVLGLPSPQFRSRIPLYRLSSPYEVASAWTPLLGHPSPRFHSSIPLHGLSRPWSCMDSSSWTPQSTNSFQSPVIFVSVDGLIKLMAVIMRKPTITTPLARVLSSTASYFYPPGQLARRL